MTIESNIIHEKDYVRNPQLFGDETHAGILPHTSLNIYPVGNCAEVDAVNRAEKILDRHNIPYPDYHKVLFQFRNLTFKSGDDTLELINKGILLGQLLRQLVYFLLQANLFPLKGYLILLSTLPKALGQFCPFRFNYLNGLA